MPSPAFVGYRRRPSQLFVAAGPVVFPGRSWWGTYLEWNSRLDYTVFIGDATTWQRDTALIVVVVAFVAALVATIAQPRHRWAWAALAMSATNIALTAVLMVVFTGPWLESPTYVAKLWPGCLDGPGLGVHLDVPGNTRGQKAVESRDHRAAGVVGAIDAVVGAIRWTLAYRTGWLIGTWCRGAHLVTARARAPFVERLDCRAARRCDGCDVHRCADPAERSRAAWVATGSIRSVRPSWTSLTGIRWHRRSRCRDGCWNERAPRGFDRDLDRCRSVDRRCGGDAAVGRGQSGHRSIRCCPGQISSDWRRLQPSVVAMYAPDRAQIDSFYASLPPWSLPSELECTSVPYLGVGTGEAIACIARLTWVG